jgi:plasmid replication initiation protein
MTNKTQQSAELTDTPKPAKRQIVPMTTIEINKLVVTQANALARSAHQMTLQEKRLLFLAMAYIRQNDNDFVCYHIPVTVIKKYLEVNDKDIYKRLHSVTDKLLSRIVKIEKENGGWKKFQWVSYCEYIPKEESDIGEACVEIQIHDHLKPLLLNLKKYFGSMHLHQIASMSSVNSIRIFEILYYSSIRFAKTELYFTVENLKERLGMEGKYANFRDFRKDVLLRAQQECENHTLLVFTWEEEKKGRKIIGLRFKVKKNPKFKDEQVPKPQIDQPLPAPKREKPHPTISVQETTTILTTEQNQVLSLLKENGVNKTTAEKLTKEFPPQRIIKNVELARQKHKTGKTKDLGGVTVAAIREDWSNIAITPSKMKKNAKYKPPMSTVPKKKVGLRI